MTSWFSRTILILLTSALSVCALVDTARADIIPPEFRICSDLSEGDACRGKHGRPGVCTPRGTCRHRHWLRMPQCTSRLLCKAGRWTPDPLQICEGKKRGDSCDGGGSICHPIENCADGDLERCTGALYCVKPRDAKPKVEIDLMDSEPTRDDGAASPPEDLQKTEATRCQSHPLTSPASLSWLVALVLLLLSARHRASARKS